MNFVFIVDTSLSMSQTFDSISYLDIAKSNIRKFVIEREISNYQNNNKKYDKYILLTFSQVCDEKFFLNSWSTITDDFIFQLNALKISYDTTSIETVIQNSYRILNFIKKIGPDKHIYGRQFNKLQNSIIILITDGGYININESFNLSSISLKDNNSYIINDKKYQIQNIYKDLYRWDQRFYALVLTNKNEEFESFKILDKICKYSNGKIITLENANLLGEKLSELNKSFQNTGALINFIINKQKKNNIITFLEYNGKIEEMNEKWLFPDELIINNENKNLPIKNPIPIYELGNIKYNFKLSPEWYDKYEIKDKQFISNILIDGDCWNNLTIYDFIKEYKTSITIDILISELLNSKILKKPFAVLNLTFSKEIMDQISDKLSNVGNILFKNFFYDYYNNINNMLKTGQKINSDLNYIKCEFFNLPYHYTELLTSIQNYKFKKINEVEFKMGIEKYCGNIPFYYIKKVINFLEKNKIKQFLDKEKEYFKQIIHNNFSNEIMKEIDILSKYENENFIKIRKQIEENKNSIISRRNKCNVSSMLCEKNNNRQFLFNRSTEKEEDEQYFDFINRAFQIDKIGSSNQIHNFNNNIIEEKNGNNNNLMNTNENDHEFDIDLMGVNREQFYRNDNLRSYLIPEVEIRYLVKEYLFGNQFIPRKAAYSKLSTSTSFTNNDAIQNETIFNYIKDEDNNMIYNTNRNNNNLNNNNNKPTGNNLELLKEMEKIITIKKIEKELKDKISANHLINNKRNREVSPNESPKKIERNLNDSINTEISSSIEPPEPKIFNDNYSESDGSNNLMLDELPDNKGPTSKMSYSLIEEFKKSLNEEPIEDGIKIEAKYKISREKLNRWKFQKIVKNFSQELFNSVHNDGNDIIKIINKIIAQNNYGYGPDKKMTYNFIEKIFKICQDYGVNQMVLNQLKNLMKCYS